MRNDSLYADDDFLFELEFDANDFVEGYRERHGDYRLGRLEDDPEQMEYEETLELGMSLCEMD